MPKRVKRRRAKGWRMPPNTIYVGRGTWWGNPYKVGEVYQSRDGKKSITVTSKEQAIEMYREYIQKELLLDPTALYIGPETEIDGESRQEIKTMSRLEFLRGKDLCCWCKDGDACHADVLLELANA